MIFELLTDIIDGRDVQEMRYSEASSLVREFYMEVAILTLGNRNKQKLEYSIRQALTNAGLECFA